MTNPTIAAALRQANVAPAVTPFTLLQEMLDAKAAAIGSVRTPAQANKAVVGIVLCGVSTGLGAATKHSQPKHRVPLALANVAVMAVALTFLIKGRARKATAA
jgi:Zn-dependent alcohol dehydrogenase